MNTHYYHSAGYKVKVTTYKQPSSESDSSSEENKHSKRHYRKKEMSPEEIRFQELNKKFYTMRTKGFLAEGWRNFYPWTDHPLRLSDEEALNRIREISESRLHPRTNLGDIHSGEIARQSLYQELLYRVELFGETPWDEQMIKDLKDDDICVIL